MSVTVETSTEEPQEDIRTELVKIYIRRKRKKGIELTVEDLICRFPISEFEAEELLSEIPEEWEVLLFSERPSGNKVHRTYPGLKSSLSMQ